MQTPAVGDGPVEFVDLEGKQHAIPLTAISFDKDGVVQSDLVVDGLQEWLAYLALHGLLAPGPAPAAVDAMTLRARNDGPTGNDIVVEVREIAVDAVEIKVTETHLYKGLTFVASEHSVSTMLDPKENGIVHQTEVTGTAADSPAAGLVQPSQLAPPPNARDGWVIEDTTGKKLAVLEPRDTNWSNGTMAVVVQDVDAAANTFTLNVAWEITATVGPADLAAADPLGELKFAVTVDPPAPGTHLRLPTPGRAMLEGGTAKVEAAAKKAHVTLLADE